MVDKNDLRINGYERLEAEVGKSRILEAVYKHIREQVGPDYDPKAISWNLDFTLHFGASVAEPMIKEKGLG